MVAEIAKLNLDGASILVTGGTGSFGRAFCKEVLERWNLRRLVVYSRDEAKQWEMSMLPEFANHPAIRFFIGDVRDQSRLEMAMRGVDHVVHAAALKHVPAAEYNPFECIRTNVHGAENVVQAAIRTNIKTVVALSTDKAVNPVNLYGASKLASDKIFVAANHLAGSDGPRFSVVRYGNVLGSRGSIIPLFRQLIAQKVESLPITDPRMTRFVITLKDGVELVLSAFATMQGGEIFVPKIPSVRMTDLAKVLAPDLPIRIIGIRPGEKLHECLITSDDARTTLDMGDHYVIEPAFHWWTRTKFLERQGTPVDESFHYSSENNPVWLSNDELGALLEAAGV